MASKKRGYYAHNNDEDQCGVAIVAMTAKEAKKIAYHSGEFIYGDPDWIAIQVRWVRNAAVHDLPIGIVHDSRDALLRGLYDCLIDCPCDECKQDAELTCYRGRALCAHCIDRGINMYLELIGGHNDCYWNVRGTCTYDLYKRVNPNFSISKRDWDSKRNCTVTQLGTQQCNAYKQEPL